MVLAARNIYRLEPVKADLTIRYGSTISLVEFDILMTDHLNWYKQFMPAPDMVISVVGYLGNHQNALSNKEECERILQTNFIGAVSILNIIANDFEAKKEGIIVGISSVAGERGRKSNYLYGSAKAGFTAYLSGLRNRLYKHKVHVLTVIPGFMRTKMLGDMKTPHFLTASPEVAAVQIIKALRGRKNIVYIYPMWRWIMLLIRLVPERYFKKLNL